MNQIIKALEFAYNKHKNQKRKISKTPYFSHLLDVVSLLTKSNSKEKLIIAGALHDTLEDTESSKKEILDIFGKEVLDYVLSVSEEKNLSWKQRKSNQIEFIKNASYEIQLLKCADVLSNLREIQYELNIYNEKIWTFFNSGKKEQEWYFKSLFSSFTKIKSENMYFEYKRLLESVFS